MSSAVSTAIRILTFRATHEELRNVGHRHLALGLFLTWVVGMGRWWEDPRASVLQHLGVGSLLYVLVLSFFLGLVTWPLAPRPVSYTNLLTFVSLTAPPALLYALPVRSWFDLAVAQELRLWFLGIVAGWRVLLWASYLRVGVQLSRLATFVGTMFPLTILVVALVALNLERVVFDFMGGIRPTDIRPEDATVNDTAFGVLFLISLLSQLLVLPLLLAYGVLATRARRARSWNTGRTGSLLPPTTDG